jgi:hypothetical protein
MQADLASADRAGKLALPILMGLLVRSERRRRHLTSGWAIVLLGVMHVIPARADGPGGAVSWEVLEPGLEFATAESPIPAAAGDSRIRVLRVDPTRYELTLLNSSAADGTRRTAKEWAGRYGLVAAINASLYQTDNSTSVSLMTARGHTNNPRLSKHNAVLLFDRLDDSVPPVQIVDRTCRDFGAVRTRYAAAVQNIRMVSCTRHNVWTPQPDKKWSTAAIGVDTQGRLLFVHVRSPLSTHDLIDALLALPLDLRETMYVEGGPEAQLYVTAGGRELEFVGSHGSSFAGIENTYALPIPNVIGLKRIGAHGG